MNFLVTGCAGFIGFHTVKELTKNKNHRVYGIDNINNFYSQKLKNDRLKILKKKSNFFFKKLDITNTKDLNNYVKNKKFEVVIHLAAQAGVRYSINNPRKFISNNIFGFFNILDISQKLNVKKFIYASSSSVYGDNNNRINKEIDNTTKPLSIYSASKMTNELFAHTYSNLYKMETIGLRFFTVYGEYARPDMFFSKLATAIKANKTISVFNNGNLYRDFTFVLDLVNCIVKLIKLKGIKTNKFEIYNIGNSKTVKLTKVIKIFEKHYNKKTKVDNFKLSKGEVKRTNSGMNKLNKIIKLKEFKNIDNGLNIFFKWHDNYYNDKQ
jgi:UDP-glucuronate 4-epimerase